MISIPHRHLNHFAVPKNDVYRVNLIPEQFERLVARWFFQNRDLPVYRGLLWLCNNFRSRNPEFGTTDQFGTHEGMPRTETCP